MEDRATQTVGRLSFATTALGECAQNRLSLFEFPGFELIGEGRSTLISDHLVYNDQIQILSQSDYPPKSKKPGIHAPQMQSTTKKSLHGAVVESGAVEKLGRGVVVFSSVGQSGKA